jgi:hypothetical protein
MRPYKTGPSIQEFVHYGVMAPVPARWPRSLVIAVVDDGRALREAIVRLLRMHGHQAEPFDSAEDFLSRVVTAYCLVLDVQLPVWTVSS